MRQKLLQKAGLLSLVLLMTGMFLSGCIEEPNPPVLDRVTSEVRFVHAVPDAPAVDIWVDDKVVAPNVGYKGFTSYLTVKAGNRWIRVVPAGADSSTALFRRQVSVRSLTKMTMAFFNSTAQMDMLLTQERFTYADETSMLVDSCDVKLINLANTSVTYVVQRKIGEGDYEDITPEVGGADLTSYVRVLSETNDFAITDYDTNGRVVEFNKTLGKPGYRYSFIVVGNSGEVDVLTLQDEPRP